MISNLHLQKKPFVTPSCLLWFLFSITILYAQEITKGPFLTDPTSNSMTIRWESDSNLDYKLNYGEKDSLNKTLDTEQIGENSGRFLYQTKIKYLKAGTEYSYQIEVNSSKLGVHSFKTAPKSDSPISFVAMGDSRSNPEIFAVLNKQIDQMGPDFIISMGDLVASGGNYDQWGEYYFGPAANVIDHIPLISCLGDHEGDGDNGELFRNFLFPALDFTKLWFSFDYGPAHFVSLDYRYPESEEMINWFKDDMEKSTRKWNFVYMHRPCYDLGGHRSHWGNPTWPELFRKYKIDIVFAGHSHLYERFYPVRPADEPESWPVTYITTGGAGAGLYDVQKSDFLAESRSAHHFTFINISGNKLEFKAILNSGEVFDHFEMIKKNGVYTQSYLNSIKSQEQLDLNNMFARAISFSLGQIPLQEHPATVNITLERGSINEPVYFKVSLTPESEKYFRMESFEDSLTSADKKNIQLKIYSLTDLQISGWGDIYPELSLMVNFKVGHDENQILGKLIDYWPDEGY